MTCCQKCCKAITRCLVKSCCKEVLSGPQGPGFRFGRARGDHEPIGQEPISLGALFAECLEQQKFANLFQVVLSCIPVATMAGSYEG